MKSKRHSPSEISAKLEQAGLLAAAGKVQSEIAKTLGISVMTLHRWRKLGPPRSTRRSRAVGPASRGYADMITALRAENRQLRQIVADLLLEKIRLEEAARLGAG